MGGSGSEALGSDTFHPSRILIETKMSGSRYTHALSKNDAMKDYRKEERSCNEPLRGIHFHFCTFKLASAAQ